MHRKYDCCEDRRERREEIPTASNEHPDSLVSSVVLMVLDIGIIYNVDLVSGLYPDIM